VQGVAHEAGEAPGAQRNAAAVLGNVGTVQDVPLLEQALADREPLVREHVAWTLVQSRRARAPYFSYQVSDSARQPL
jgi:epoxyqueuosine reductase QueG